MAQGAAAILSALLSAVGLIAKHRQAISLLFLMLKLLAKVYRMATASDGRSSARRRSAGARGGPWSTRQPSLPGWSSPPKTPRSTPRVNSAGVPWEDYDPSVKWRIDSLAVARDCVGLQAEFDVADATNDATHARTGHNNADLMVYINDKMQAAGCYD